MHYLNQILSTIDSYLGSSQWFPLLLIGTGIFFTIYLKFPQFRFFRHALKVVSGKFDKEEDKGDTSHFQALTTALSGTVGTGNIAGVALAIFIGGPAALFWMLLTAFLGMTTKFVEVTLSHKYREVDDKGFISGGPMYYMKNGLNMKWMAGFFAAMTILTSFGVGNFPQINSISNSLFSTFGINKMLVGGILAIILAAVVLGGIKRIAKVTERLVPSMALIYFIGAISVLCYNYENVIPSLISVFSNVFTGTSAFGGFLGAGFSFALTKGVNRGLFSNEAGAGSAPIAHAAARTKEPVSEGMVAILEPFIDTIVICTLTGLVILSSGVWKEKLPNKFQPTDTIFMASQYSDDNPKDVEKLFHFLSGETTLPLFNGELLVENGMIQNKLSIINARSLAENVKVYDSNNNLYSGIIPIQNGENKSTKGLYFKGNSLVHSAPLTAVAFTRSWFGSAGSWIVSIGLVLFAFSTSIAWAYYGGRSITYLFGTKGLLAYRLIYCASFFVASFTDTTIVWVISAITMTLMSVPNLIGLLMLRKDMRNTVNEYVVKFRDEHPSGKL